MPNIKERRYRPMAQPVINAADHSTPILNCIRRCKRKTKTSRYWRLDNHNIQADTNAVINLSTVKLSQAENQLFARGLSFYPTPVTSTGLRLELIFRLEFSRWMRVGPRVLLGLSPQTYLNPGPLPYTGTLHLTLFLRLSGMTS